VKNYLIIIIVFLFTISVKGQTKETIAQNRADYVGIKTKSFFLQQPHAKWFHKSYDHYKLDSRTIDKLKGHISGVQIKVFMSVWCHDSHREIPRLFKVLEAIDFDEKNLEIVALNRVKKTPNNLQEGFDIRRTPTLIFYKNDKEIGRFVEHPRKILEKDILKILSGKNYKHVYFKDFAH
jgi:thiol-disulfide isomerase/thioredoxin